MRGALLVRGKAHYGTQRPPQITLNATTYTLPYHFIKELTSTKVPARSHNVPCISLYGVWSGRVFIVYLFLVLLLFSSLSSCINQCPSSLPSVPSSSHSIFSPFSISFTLLFLSLLQLLLHLLTCISKRDLKAQRSSHKFLITPRALHLPSFSHASPSFHIPVTLLLLR